MKDITPQQQKVLDCIQVYINKTGFPPTRADICRELGFKSPNSAETHLRALEKKDFISIESGASRGISINNPEIKHEGNEYPIVGLVAAGSPTLASENVEKVLNCPKGFFGSDFDYFLRVRGLSMKDAGIMEDDLIAVKNAGAYGFVMASNYNSRPKDCEILIDGNQSKIIRQRETLDDLLEKEKIEND